MGQFFIPRSRIGPKTDTPFLEMGRLFILCSRVQQEYNRNLSTRLTEHKRATKNGDVNNHIAEHHLKTKHQIDWDSATCITYITDYYQRLTLTTAQVVETSVTVNNNSPIQDYVHLDDQTQPTFVISIIISITHTITLGLPVVFSCPIFWLRRM